MSNRVVGERMQQRRKQIGLTLDDIAQEIGVAKSTIQRYETGNIKRLKLPVIEAIARVLSVSPSWLCGKSEDMYESTPAPISESEGRNVMRIAGRDGRFVEKVLTDEQVDAWMAIVEQLPDADDL